MIEPGTFSFHDAISQGTSGHGLFVVACIAGSRVSQGSVHRGGSLALRVRAGAQASRSLP